MTQNLSAHEKFLQDPEKRKIFEQERLMVDATELLTFAMDLRGAKRHELAQKLGRSKAYITQMLRGTQNLTLRTLADVFHALNCRILIAAEGPGIGMIVSSQWNTSYQTGNITIMDDHETSDDFSMEYAA